MATSPQRQPDDDEKYRDRVYGEMNTTQKEQGINEVLCQIMCNKL